MKFLKWLDGNLEVFCCGCLLSVLSVVMMIQVVMRYVFSAPLSWPEELSRYCYIWITFLSIGLTIRTGSYFRVTALIDMLPRKGRQLMEFISHLVNLAFYGVCAYYSIDILKTVYSSTQTTPALRLPMYFIYIVLPLGMFLALVRSLQMSFLSGRKLLSRQPQEESE